MPEPHKSHIAATVALTLAAMCIATEVYLRVSGVAADAKEGVQTELSELSYIGKWQPTRAPEGGHPPIYYPGENVFCHTRRHVKFSGRAVLPLLVASSLQNLETGAEYGLPPVARILTQQGELNIDTVRTIPLSVPPGRYKISGWAKTETEHRPSFAVFESEEIEVANATPK